MNKFMTARKSSARLLASLGLAALISCSSGSSEDSYPDSVDTSDRTKASVVEATGSSENAKDTDKRLSSQGDATEVNALASSNRSNNSPAATQVSNNTVAENTSALGLVEGMPYIEARTILIQQDWIPLEQPEPGPYGVEREMYDLGVREVSACSGTGVGYCAFSFYKLDSSRPEGHLRFGVTTVGGSKVEVSAWESNFVAGPPPVIESGPESNNSQPVAAQTTNAGSGASVQQRTYIPVQFRALWNFSTDECAVPYTQGRLQLQGDRLSFYESSGPVTEVTSRGEYEVTVSTELSGEGETYTNTYTFQLAEDYSSITDTETGVVRYRCPDV